MQLRSLLTIFALSLFSVQAADSNCLELRIYHVGKGKVDAQIERFEVVADKTLRKYGLIPLGYWLTTNAEENVKLVYLVSTPTREASREGFRSLGGDADFKAFYKVSGDKHGKVTEKVDSIFLKPLDFSPSQEFPPKNQITELRLYTVETNKMQDYLATYKAKLPLYKKHGIKNISVWTAQDEKKYPNLVVLALGHKDQETAKKSIEAYHHDADWVKAEEQWNKNGKLTSKMDSHFMYPLQLKSVQAK